VIISTKDFRLRGAEQLNRDLRAQLILKEMKIAELEAALEVLAREVAWGYGFKKTRKVIRNYIKAAKKKAHHNLYRRKKNDRNRKTNRDNQDGAFTRGEAH